LLKRFPYALYFRLHDDTIVFVLLFHEHVTRASCGGLYASGV